MTTTASIWCVQCNGDVEAVLVTGRDVYPQERNRGLWEQPFYRCPRCAGHVGTHHKNAKPGKIPKPLGCIPTPALRDARRHIHAILDPLWKAEPPLYRRPSLYAELSRRVGWGFHTSHLRSVEDARDVWRIVKAMRQEAEAGGHPYQLLALANPIGQIIWPNKQERAPVVLMELPAIACPTSTRTPTTTEQPQ